jgi:hypothetical protein
VKKNMPKIGGLRLFNTADEQLRVGKIFATASVFALANRALVQDE